MNGWEWDGQYPVRCRIVDVTGQVMGDMALSTPPASKPYIGEVGTAHEEGFLRVRIDLDSGATLWGHQCWWEAISPEAVN